MISSKDLAHEQPRPWLRIPFSSAPLCRREEGHGPPGCFRYSQPPRGLHWIFDLCDGEKNLILYINLTEQLQLRKSNSDLPQNVWKEGSRTMSLWSSVSLLNKIILRRRMKWLRFVWCPGCVSSPSSQGKMCTFLWPRKPANVSNLRFFSFQTLPKSRYFADTPAADRACFLYSFYFTGGYFTAFVCVSLSSPQSMWETIG